VDRVLQQYLKYTAVGLFGGGIAHIFFPEFSDRRTNWNLAPGWQREIAFWDLTIAGTLGHIYATDNEQAARAMAPGLASLNVLLAWNHLSAFRRDYSAATHLLLAALNACGSYYGFKAVAQSHHCRKSGDERRSGHPALTGESAGGASRRKGG
jgi:hypothetical protein